MSVRVLPKNVSEKIAAGEVIERPHSVVKELVENALDAKATEILVRLVDGGKSLIEITDNGCGMNRKDLELCTQRHATSKISNLDDLIRIQSLGFRGEALPSVAAVSHLKIISRPKGQKEALEWSASGVRPVTYGHFLTDQHGTCVQAEGLFSEVPARLKFLKSARSEVSFIRDTLERLALAHPECGFQLTHQDRTLFSVRPQTEEERVREILSDQQDFPLESHFEEYDRETTSSGAELPEMELQLYWLRGLSLASSRKIFQTVNGRSVRDRLLQSALGQPFRQLLLPGQYPALYMRLEVSPSFLDVNVHPTKTELRFLNSQAIFKRVSGAVEELTLKRGNMSFVAAREVETEAPRTVFQLQEPKFEPVEMAIPIREQAPLSMPKAHSLSDARFSGILFRTYIVYEKDRSAVLIDQHAAHERVRFEKLKKRAQTHDELGQQRLLLPETIAYPAEQEERIADLVGVLSDLDFEVEPFGQGRLIFRGVPGYWGKTNLGVRLKGMVDRLLESNDPIGLDEHLFEKLASEACHSAVRAGDPLDEFEARALVDELFECENPWNCPHGRPTTTEIPLARFEEWFQRRI